MWEPIGAAEQSLHVATLDFDVGSVSGPIASALVFASAKALPLDSALPIPLNGCTYFEGVTVTAQKKRLSLDSTQVACAKEFTRVLLRAVLNRPLELKENAAAFLILPARWVAKETNGFRRVRHTNILWADMNVGLGDLFRTFPEENILEATQDGMTTYRSEFSARFYVDGEPVVEDGKSHLILIRARATASFLDPSSEAVELPSVIKVATSNCLLYGVKASVYRAAQCLPSILTILNDLMAAQHINETSFKGSMPIVDTAKAFSAPSALRPWDYQRLELLGDVLLKLMATISLYITQPNANNQLLNAGRSKIVNNKQLAEKMAQAGLHSFIIHEPLRIKSFEPAGFSGGAQKAKASDVASKRIADVAEALIGAASDGGLCIEKAFAVAKRIGVDLPARSWSLLLAQSVPELPRHTPKKGMVVFSHQFTYSCLMTEAISMKDEASQMRQRMEFIGDAILDYLVMFEIQKAYSGETEGDLSQMKERAVSPRTLAALSVHFGFHEIVNCTSAQRGQIAKYVGCLNSAKEAGADCEPPRPYWLDLTPPKGLIVSFKAILGALIHDSNYNLQTVRDVFDMSIALFYHSHGVFVLETAPKTKKRKRE